MTEQLASDDVPVNDRRRFTADGERRPTFDAEGGLEALIESVPAAAPGAAAEAQEWERRARDAESKLGELAEGLRRARSGLEAARARLERDQEARVREALGRSFERILAVVDNLDRALEHGDDSPLATGVRLVQRQLQEILATEGVERLEVLGRSFDPALAEAVATSPASADQCANTVVEELRAGYRFGGRVLRPAQVRVAV